MTRRLQKWEGAGNDFLVELGDADDLAWWTPERAAAACDRHRGVGADGVLLGAWGDPIAMTLFNADGSRAEMSGNGIRCLAAAVRRVRLAPGALRVATDAGEREVEIEVAGNCGRGSVAMGEVRLMPAPEGALGAASVGNPHVVVRDDPSWSLRDREEIAERLAAPLGGANVEFIRVLGTDRIAMSVIERGVGWTLACGTGSCAAAAVLHDLGEVGDTVVVENPGGELTVSLAGASARLGGPVRFVGDVEWVGA
jgi:diaminopimelate epimerase